MPRQQPLLLPSLIGPLLALLLGAAAFAAAGKPPKPQGIAFFAGFSDYAVLQRGPGRAAVYGSLGPGGTGATVQLSSSGGAAEGSSEEPVLVEATATPDGRWKALLPAHPAGGDYTLTATCHGCTTEPKTAALRHVVRPLPAPPVAAPLCAEARCAAGTADVRRRRLLLGSVKHVAPPAAHTHAQRHPRIARCGEVPQHQVRKAPQRPTSAKMT